MAVPARVEDKGSRRMTAFDYTSMAATATRLLTRFGSAM
jgi:hypothetical protein